MIETLERYAGRIAAQRHLQSLRDGIVLAMPLIIIGSIFLILGNLPIQGYPEMLAEYGINEWINKIVNATFGLMALAAVFGMSRSLANYYHTDGTSAGILAIAAYILVSPDLVSETGAGVNYTYLGSSGLFVAIVVGLSSAEIFRFFVQKNWVIKMPDGVPPAVSQSFAALLPGLMVILFWSAIYIILQISGIENIHDVLTNTLGRPLSAVGSSIWGTLLMVGFNSLFWFIGIHGANTTNPIIQPIWLQNTDANRLAFQAGEELPHIITNEFMMNFVWIGGGGATIGLVICLFFFVRSQQNKAMGKLSFLPGLFNINEPVMFGLPVVLNFKMLVPFILSPMANALITYFAMASGLVAKPAGIVVPWTMPPIISGYLATGGQNSGAVIQIVTVAVSTLIYYPFVRSLDKDKLRVEEEERASREKDHYTQQMQQPQA
ncbi:PTS cellobiose transporter subunit IIC [Atopococcus tabaci]|uniref:PTS cellobiose transporter subunit IIC n=1 Tax=Atopococcus tabaci TaxID=269774 RepID=UPI0004002B5E|nr:PTS cellobiose transporter subunit IIC [Atopococcus tabaci]